MSTHATAQPLARGAVTTAPQTRCRHGFLPGMCAPCDEATAPTPPRVPTKRYAATLPQPHRRLAAEAAAPLPHNNVHGLGPVYTVGVGCGRATTERMIAALPPTTTVVHISGHPHVWIVQGVLARCPDLRVIEVTPAQERVLSATHHALCWDRGVRITIGSVNPEATGARMGLARGTYQAQRTFMWGLAGEQRALFEELLVFGFEAAEVTARYYGLAGDDAYISQWRVAEEFGLAQRTGNRLVSKMTGAVLRYLDPTCDVGMASVAHAEAIARRVLRLHQTATTGAALQEWLVKLGIPAVPPGLPPIRFDLFEFALAAFRDGRLAALDERTQGILRKRFGLNDLGVARALKLREIGDELGLTRERIRQLERDGLATLGWQADELDD